MKKIALFVVIFITSGINIPTFATPKDVVSLFGQYLSSWCNTDDVQYRDRIERLCSGVKSCRVEDKIHADYQRKRGYMDYETYFLDSYLNMFQTLIPTGVKYSLSNIVVETQDQYPNGQVLTFITADVKLSGKINQTAKDLFLVRDDKISGIYHYSSEYGFKHLNGSLIAELNRGRYVECSSWIYDYAVVRRNDGRSCLIDKKGHIIHIGDDDVIGNDYVINKLENNKIYAEEYGGAIPTGIIYELDKGKSRRVPFNYFWLGEQMDLSFCEAIQLGHFASNVHYFIDGYAVVKKDDNGNIKCGYLKETDSQYNVDYLYEEASMFYKGFAAVKKDGVSQIIDNNFNAVVQAPKGYEFIDDFYFDDGLFILTNKSTNRKGVINHDGQIVIPCKYWILEEIHNGRAAACEKIDAFGFIDVRGVPKIPFVYKYVYYFQDGVCWATRGEISDGEWELIDINGKSLINHIDIDLYSYKFVNGQTKISSSYRGRKYAIIDRYGRTVSGFNWQHDYIGDISKTGLMHIEINGKHGYVNGNGQEVICSRYDYAEDFGGRDYTVVGEYKKGQMKYGIINTSGAYIIPPTFDRIQLPYDNKVDFCIVGIIKNNTIKYGSVDLSGKIVIPIKYDEICYPSENNGYARVSVTINGKMKHGYANSEGVEIVPCQYDNYIYFQDGTGTALATKDGNVGLIDLYGNSYLFN